MNVDRRKSATNPETSSMNVCQPPIFCNLLTFSVELLTAPPPTLAPNTPKGPNLEKVQDRLKFSISLENFNLA